MQFKTLNTLYTLVDLGDGAFTIQGHPKYCPVPTKCELMEPIEVGKCVWFTTYSGGFPKLVRTTPVQEIIS